MEHCPAAAPRVAAVEEAVTVAVLLDAFNREFDTASPGVTVLTQRLQRLLTGKHVVALLAGEPAVGVALLTLRPNVWYDGPVAVLDELYVAPGLRGRAIGSALLAAAEFVVQQRGCELLEINVDGADIDARRFYERHGYRTIEPGHEQPSFYYHRELASAASPGNYYDL